MCTSATIISSERSQRPRSSRKCSTCSRRRRHRRPKLSHSSGHSHISRTTVPIIIASTITNTGRPTIQSPDVVRPPFSATVPPWRPPLRSRMHRQCTAYSCDAPKVRIVCAQPMPTANRRRRAHWRNNTSSRRRNRTATVSIVSTRSSRTLPPHRHRHQSTICPTSS